MSKRTIIYLLFIVGYGSGFAQDLHYSQFYYGYHNLSPSLIGDFDGNDRITFNYRNQWLSLPVPYNTFSVLYDANRPHKKGSFWGFGVGLDYDRAGDSKLSLAKLVLNASYILRVSSRNKISFGISPAFAQRRISSEALRWDRQWNGDRYDPNISSNENFASSGDFFVDLGAGVSYRFNYTNRTELLISGAAFHLNKPNQTFYGSSAQAVSLPSRYSLGLHIGIGLGQSLDLLVGANYQTQEKYKETVGSARLRFRLNRTPGSVLNLLGGCNIRLDDAIIPNLGIEYKNWLISASYDINNSFFNLATNKRGGPEIAVQYIFAKVNTSGIYKKCPMY
ncbi:MAG: PorP/SprF family type IX secretion system membrane protein [Saprospiraceae bacterium]|nr:PorP/SprF family type IX secretion system membrane protein [Saprospiraceae bacterium]